jgi:peptidyl-prolyl cis-trans isomerase SurA
MRVIPRHIRYFHLRPAALIAVVLMPWPMAGLALAQSPQGVTVTVPPSSGTPNLPEIVVPSEPPAPPAKTKPKVPGAGAKEKGGAKSAAIDPNGDGKSGKVKGSQSIVVLVNDEPITGYEISQRQRLMGMGNANIGQRAQDNFKSLIKAKSTNDRLKAILNKTIQENQGKSREEILAIFERRKQDFAKGLQQQAVEQARQSVMPGLRKEALEELIDERLKLQEAKRLNVVVGDDEIDTIMRSIAEKNKMTDSQFAAHLKKMGADANVMRNRFKANMSWQQVVRRRFGHMVSISERDVDRFVEKSPVADGEGVELQVQRITLPIPAKLEQKLLAQRLAEAEGLMRRGGGCGQMSANAASVAGARFENLGPRMPNTIPEPTRSLLLNARDGELLPPTVAAGGVEIWAVCGRKTVAADLQKRESVQAELRQKEFEVLAKKHLKDLRQDAAIEYR